MTFRRGRPMEPGHGSFVRGPAMASTHEVNTLGMPSGGQRNISRRRARLRW